MDRDPQHETHSTDALAARIDPWLAHMRWRPDFVRWRTERIHQERYQDEALRLLREGMAIAGGGTDARGNGEGPRLLDVGCGMGGFAVAAALQGARVVGVEYNPGYAAITELRAARHHLHLPVVVAAGEAIPLPAARFDAATCWDVLEHVQSPDLLLAELARTLRPGGVLLLTAINRLAFRDPHYHLPLLNWMPRPAAEALIVLAGRRKGGAFRDRQQLSSMHYYTWGALSRLASRHGFRLYDLDARRVARGDIGSRHHWRRMLVRSQRAALLAYYAYRTIWQGTWRVALVKQEGPTLL
jgi:2-polyprenyl-3-methyl-5-hydroxy-6-metoxy-1,4-benzoquinol methylase